MLVYKEVYVVFRAHCNEFYAQLQVYLYLSHFVSCRNLEEFVGRVCTFCSIYDTFHKPACFCVEGSVERFNIIDFGFKSRLNVDMNIFTKRREFNVTC